MPTTLLFASDDSCFTIFIIFTTLVPTETPPVNPAPPPPANAVDDDAAQYEGARPPEKASSRRWVRVLAKGIEDVIDHLLFVILIGEDER